MDRKIEKKKFSVKRLLSLGVVIIFALFSAYVFLIRDNNRTMSVDAQRVTISTVKKGPFTEFIPVLGRVRPHNTVFLDAVEGGTVETVYLEAGSKVKKGDVILKLSNTNLLMSVLDNDVQINRAANELRSARLLMAREKLDLERQKADADYFLGSSQKKYRRYKVLYAEKLVSQQDFEEIEDTYLYWNRVHTVTLKSLEQNLVYRSQQISQLETSLKQMNGSLSLVKQQLEHLTVRAPISGYLTSLTAEKGQSKSRGQRLGRIDDTNGFKIRTQISEHYLHRVDKGKKGWFDFSGKTHELVIDKIFLEVTDGKFEVDMLFTRSQPKGIKRGQTIHTRLQLSDPTQAVMIDRGGFFQDTGGDWVYVLDKNGKTATKRRVKLGRQNPLFLEVLEGLTPGERVITSSYQSFGDNDRLELTNTANQLENTYGVQFK